MEKLQTFVKHTPACSVCLQAQMYYCSLYMVEDQDGTEPFNLWLNNTPVTPDSVDSFKRIL